MAFNPLRRLGEQVEAAALGANPSAAANCLREVLAFSQGQVGGRHQFNFDQTLVQQLQTSGFGNTSFFSREWDAYRAEYRRTHQNSDPNLETVRTQFLAPFVNAVSHLLFPAGQRDTQNYRDFRQLLGRWALCQTMFNNMVQSEFTPQQRRLLQRSDWLHLSETQRNQLLRNNRELGDMAQNQETRDRMMELPSFSAEDAARLARLIPRPADAGGGGPQQMSPEEANLQRGVRRYLETHPARRAHLNALLARAPQERSAGDTIELTACSLLPHCRNTPGTYQVTYQDLLTYALYQYLSRQPNGLTGEMSPQLRAQLQVHSSDATTRDAILNLVAGARAFQRNPRHNAILTAFSTAWGERDMPGMRR